MKGRITNEDWPIWPDHILGHFRPFFDTLIRSHFWRISINSFIGKHVKSKIGCQNLFKRWLQNFFRTLFSCIFWLFFKIFLGCKSISMIYIGNHWILKNLKPKSLYFQSSGLFLKWNSKKLENGIYEQLNFRASLFKAHFYFKSLKTHKSFIFKL